MLNCVKGLQHIEKGASNVLFTALWVLCLDLLLYEVIFLHGGQMMQSIEIKTITEFFPSDANMNAFTRAFYW